MVNPVAPVERVALFYTFSGQFYRRFGGGGKIFFAGSHGNAVVPLKVFDDGTVSGQMDGTDLPDLDESVEIVHREDLGITEIKFAEI